MLLALTRLVPPSIADCELTHLQRERIDWARATEQHEQYEAALRAIGCKVERVQSDASQPDSAFIEDTAVVVDEFAIISRPGAPSRRGETAAVAEALRKHRSVSCIEAPATLDGGDVLRVGRRVFVGLSSRTDADAARQLADILAPLDYSVETIAVRGCLHLKTAATALGDDRIVLDPRLVDGAAFGGIAWIEVDPAEPMAANVVCVGRTVLCPAAAPRTRRRLEREGFDVFAVDASELAKAEGGLTCCSLLLKV